MRTIRLCASIVIFASIPRMEAQAQFEGTITMRLSSSSGGGEMQYSIKGQQLRIDISNGQMGMYILADNGGKAKMVMPSQHVYIEPSLAGAAASSAKAAKKVSIKATGRMETIADYRCEHYTMTSEDGEYDACLSKELGTFMAPMNPMGARGGAAASGDVLSELGRNAFPLKVQKVGGATTLQVTKIDKKKLDASLFTLPADFRKMDMGAMRGRP